MENIKKKFPITYHYADHVMLKEITQKKEEKKTIGNHYRRLSVIGINKYGVEEIYVSIKEASMINKILRTSILNCLAGRAKTAGGYKWRYLDA